MGSILITVVLVLAGAASTFALVRLAKARNAVVPAPGTPSIQPVDVEAFRNLVDPEEEVYLRKGLAPAQFRKVHRQRSQAAIGYIHCVSRNAAVLMKVGEAARRSPDSSVVKAGDELVNSALRLRLYALQAQGILYLRMALPGVRIRPLEIAENYARLTDLVAVLRCLEYPTRQAR